MPPRRFAPLAALALAAATLPALAAPTPTSAAFAGGNGRIVFTQTAPEFADEDIWSMAANGTDKQQLTDNQDGFDVAPAWSADGTKIAFARVNIGVDEVHIWVMDADGTDEVDLGEGTKPVWSPDGTKIAFHSSVGDLHVWTMDANGANREQLTDVSGSYNPSWSPDGSRIAYEVSGDLWTIKPDGTGATKVLDDGHAPDWSPDGKRLVFYRFGLLFSAIYSVPATGGAVVAQSAPITGLPNDVYDPVYSPDGTKIIATGGELVGEEFVQDLYSFSVTATGAATNLSNTTNFIEDDADWQASPPYPFGDIATSPFRADILWLRDQAITSGCTTFLFCPDAPVTRGQMASFLARALALPGTATDYFSDDETSVHETDINKVAAAGIASGCGAGKYCPTATVTRAQMASFLARALALPGTLTDYFTDDETSVHETDINRVAAAGIASGCGGGKYCPTNPVTRGQMAAFLHRALD